MWKLREKKNQKGEDFLDGVVPSEKKEEKIYIYLCELVLV